jgi:hypothetical protein
VSTVYQDVNSQETRVQNCQDILGAQKSLITLIS